MSTPMWPAVVTAVSLAVAGASVTTYFHGPGRVARATNAVADLRPADALRILGAAGQGRAHLIRASALIALGENHAADTELRAALSSALDPVDVRRAHHNRSVVLLRLASAGSDPHRGAYAAEAFSAAQEALRLDPRRADTRWNLAVAARWAAERSSSKSGVADGGVPLSLPTEEAQSRGEGPRDPRPGRGPGCLRGRYRPQVRAAPRLFGQDQAGGLQGPEKNPAAGPQGAARPAG